MSPQTTTANLWETLCTDFQQQRTLAKDPASQNRIVDWFTSSANSLFEQHPYYLAEALEIAGDIYQDLKATDIAAQSFQAALALSNGLSSHTTSARIATKLGVLYESSSQYEHAANYYHRAIRYHQKAQDFSNIPALLNNLGEIERVQNRSHEAEGYYLQAVQQAENLYGKDHPEVAIFLNNLGVCDTETGHFERAEDAHLRAISIYERNYGPHHPDVGRSMHNLAVTYHLKGDLLRARRFYEAALSTLKRSVSPDDPHLSMAISNFAALTECE